MTNDIRRSPIRHLTLSLSLSLFLAACGGELPFPGLTTQEIYALGVQAAQQEEWEEAVESFEYVLFSPGFNRAIEARSPSRPPREGRRYLTEVKEAANRRL